MQCDDAKDDILTLVLFVTSNYLDLFTSILVSETKVLVLALQPLPYLPVGNTAYFSNFLMQNYGFLN